MAERFAFVLALWDGDANGVLAWLQVVEVEVDGIRGCAGTPARARVVRGRKSVPEIARNGALVTEGGAVATPRGMGE